MSTATLAEPAVAVPTQRRSARTVPGTMAAIAGRVGTALLVLLGAATVVFGVQTLMPGDRATLLLNISTGQAVERTPEELAPINERYGFEDPLFAQYVRYIADLARGDLGTSYQLHAPVTEVIAEQVGPTIQLAVGALALAWLLTLVGVVATAGRGRVLTGLGSGLESLAASLPHYWLGVILLVIFAVQLRWFPVMGGADVASSVLPVVTLAIPLAGFLGQSTRDEFQRVLQQPFVTSVRARGMSDVGVRLRHVLRHAVVPAVTLSGWALGALLSGAVIVESVFSRPGLGQVLVSAVNARDIPVVAGIVVLVALVYVVANVLVDLAYTVIDPRRRDR